MYEILVLRSDKTVTLTTLKYSSNKSSRFTGDGTSIYSQPGHTFHVNNAYYAGNKCKEKSWAADIFIKSITTCKKTRQYLPLKIALNNSCRHTIHSDILRSTKFNHEMIICGRVVYLYLV